MEEVNEQGQHPNAGIIGNDDVDEEVLSYQEKVRLQIERDDPDLTELRIGLEGGLIPIDGDWASLGMSIGRNTKLKDVSFCQIEHQAQIEEEDAENLFRGLASNRSIRKLTLRLCVGDTFNILIPFFKNNKNFESLVVDHALPECFGSIAAALSEFSSLKAFEFYNSVEEETDTEDIDHALASHTGLRVVKLDQAPVGRRGCSALSNLLQNPSSSLAMLHLAAYIDDEAADILATGLTGSKALTELVLSNDRLAEMVWRAVSALLLSPGCSLEKLNMQSNEINDAVALSLSHALSANGTLKTLDLSCMSETSTITNAGWWAIFQVLQSSKSALEVLQLRHIDFNDKAINDLTGALARNNKLKELDLSRNRWGRDDGVSVEAWASFSAVFASRSALEILRLVGNEGINDEVVTIFGDALVNNNTLRELNLQGTGITAAGFNALLPVLCNASSITATYQSNHSLEKILLEDDDEDDVPEEVKSLLTLNRDNSRSQAARLKIIKTHFSGANISMEPFNDSNMKLGVLPHAAAWMGRDGIGAYTSGEGFNLLFQFSRDVLSGRL